MPPTHPRYHLRKVPPTLELRSVVKSFASHTAVNGVSWALEKGRFYSLLGPSGCGKTTTLRLVAGFEKPTSGQVLLDGEVIDHKPPFQRNVSTVFQSYALFPHLTVAQNVEFGLRERRVPDRSGRAKEALRLVQLEDKGSRLPSELSGGERQRVALARSLVLEPAVLLLDEPLAALDLKLRQQMRAELKQMQQRTGVTFLFVTHDQEEALSMSDEMAVMNAGRIEQAGAPRDLYLHPKTRFVANFLGAVNWIDGVGVRPEALRLVRGQSEPAATVERSVFLGPCVHVVARTHAGAEVTAEVTPHDAAFQPGERVGLQWSPSDEIRPES